MKIVLTVNGERRALDVQPLRRLLDVLREDLGLTGTKEGCGEGECGACAVQVDGRLLNACQMPVYQAHGRRVVTVEGLGDPAAPDPVQEAFVTEGAVQCGFCTPGLVMASRALLDENPAPTDHEIRTALAGNLCRCTGYGRVVEAVKRAALQADETDAVPPGEESVAPPAPSPGDAAVVHLPASLDAALAVLAESADEVTVVAGATDLSVLMHLGLSRPRVVLDVSRLPELRGIELADDRVVIGAAVTYTELMRSPLIGGELPALAEAARLVGAPAVQNAGTLGGNLVNASPGADAVPPLLALDAVVRVASRGGAREIPADAFHLDYRVCDLEPDELVVSIAVPVPHDRMRQAFYKAGTRRAQSIARVNLACRGRLDKRNRLRDVRLAAGSVAPTTLLLRETMAWLEGRQLTPQGLADTAREAAALAAREVSPIDDVRSTVAYRRTVTGNLVARFLRTFAP
ncbi:FAD binding domain-containing protein [bacterium]|nr:FAD binding domain-containing protein [bacterium]MBU1073127.1 FAD binding domain-containing protein [bacterium]MBU1675694.1 FAD binding domain-containing protein [bacterium]